MKLKAYTLFDNKALIYHPPFYAQNNNVAKRIVTDTANDLNTSVGRHPTDFVLYCCGEWDDQRGLFFPSAPLEHVVDCIALVNKPVELFPQAAQ